ncbi:MAG TPA: SPFH domain-containing protein [Candidatus Acidoferrales bacterium]|nr:SPFH domain-containing protein [Candidatus Acidoferrales bacterium]
MDLNTVAFAVVVIVAVIFFLMLVSAIRVVREYERLVVFRFGRCIGQKGPGIIFIVPVVDVASRVDLREQYLEVPRQTCITKDNASISIDFLVYWKVTDPVQSVVQVQDFGGATRGIAMTTLRAVVGDIPLDDVLAKREEINSVLRGKLDEVTERWGGKVTSVEIREIDPPKDVQDAMTKQMSAERSRRAMVTAAEGDRTARITVADGEKQSAILKAEGDKQSAILRAEGYSLALQKIFEVAKTLDPNTMSLQYLEALKNLGASSASKFIFPMEFVSFLKPFLPASQAPAAGTPGSQGR